MHRERIRNEDINKNRLCERAVCGSCMWGESEGGTVVKEV